MSSWRFFFSCLPSEHNALIDPGEAPLVLGRICRHWREVVYSAPMLWSSIHIPSLDYSKTPANILSGFKRNIAAWLERSIPCPLSVSFLDQSFYEPVHGEHPLITQLLPLSRRLRHLELAGNAQFFLPLLRLGSEDLPLLKRLWIRSNRGHLALDCINAFQIPTLEDVTLRVSTSVDPPSFPFRWSQLRRLCLQCFSVWTDDGSEGGLDLRAALDVLRLCPSLVHCEIRVTKGSVSDPTSGVPPIILPHLETLVLNQYAFHNWILDVPKLRCLRVGNAWDLKASNLAPHGSLSADIDPHSLASPDGLGGILQAFPTISHLRLSSATGLVSQDHFALFGPPHDLCPKLTHFTAISPSETFSDAAVLAFIKARMAIPTPLQQFRVRFDRPREVDIMPELETFIADGLRVALEYPPPQWNFDAREGLPP
ncbi:Hexose carrier protein [Mycena sanguinolenta]|uniref:Hexose carrier protein n=1 Tax=Mycena sanguinolenta TaxID=230812 RepID=A0A8H7CU83_9AGAR|nr:Hexose carrier protein [Mycena sanguinolenta]